MQSKSFEEIGMDKSIPHIGVIMENKNPAQYPRYGLPEGYTFAHYSAGMERAWSELEFSVEQTDTLEEAEKLFMREFMAQPEELSRKMIFVLDEKGEVAGTSSVWDGNHFGQTLQRVHWVAVSPRHQGKGIAKAMLTKVLDIFNELGYKDYIYLTSQTWSYKALNMYMKFGFTPYFGEQPQNWRIIDPDGNESPLDYATENEAAWALIFPKIDAYARRL